MKRSDGPGIRRWGSVSLLSWQASWILAGNSVFTGKTDPHAPRPQRQSVLLVPMGSLGTKVIRPLTVYGLEDVPR